ncbi:alanyl-tRNA editing protein [Aliikangiella marina]|uniref:Alanine--tRNA ligase n=1 Tax=Aliikangiella marina TaxID=1712262 RepID=A0A545T4N5_9GAMM|nr:alanyl-tRNA editing protein [Aliikangiella marina]TQV72155.1 alanyl-tRNA editing protein [Aliikangiella marina]
MTIALFADDAYLKACQAKVTAINERGGIILDQTVFYPTGGGQPGDSGTLSIDGRTINIATTIKDRDTGEIVHVPADNQPELMIGENVQASIDWQRRYLHMRMHTALHLLCSVIPCGVTGGQIGEAKSRLDFDIGEASLDKQAISEALQALVNQNLTVTTQWITDQELDQSPDLVRTMSVQPPKGAGKVRLLKIGDTVDLQPCGGTHVKNTAEIGALKVSKIENKGKRNRRVNIIWDGVR